MKKLLLFSGLMGISSGLFGVVNAERSVLSPIGFRGDGGTQNTNSAIKNLNCDKEWDQLMSWHDGFKNDQSSDALKNLLRSLRFYEYCLYSPKSPRVPTAGPIIEHTIPTFLKPIKIKAKNGLGKVDGVWWDGTVTSTTAPSIKTCNCGSENLLLTQFDDCCYACNNSFDNFGGVVDGWSWGLKKGVNEIPNNGWTCKGREFKDATKDGKRQIVSEKKRNFTSKK